MSVESRRESRKRVRQGDIPEIDISIEANDLVTALSRASTIAKEVADDSFGEFSDLSRKFARFTSIASVGQAVLDIMETGDTESVLWESIGSHVVGAAAAGAVGLRVRNPYFIGLVTIGGGIAGAEGVQAAIDWLRKSDVEKLEDIESVIEWIKKPKGYQDDPNFSPPEELDKGGAPAAMGSSRAPGQRGSINPVDVHNALDGLTAENALYDGSLFRTAIEADRARLQREQAPHASGESQQDSTGRRSRGPYDLEGPEAALRLDATATQDATQNATGAQTQVRTAEQMQAATTMPLSTRYLQYGLPGSRYHAYLEFLDNEKNKARRAEKQPPIRAPRAQSQPPAQRGPQGTLAQRIYAQPPQTQGMQSQGNAGHSPFSHGLGRYSSAFAEGTQNGFWKSTPFDPNQPSQLPRLSITEPLGRYRSASEFISALLGHPHPSRTNAGGRSPTIAASSAPVLIGSHGINRSARPTLARSKTRYEEEMEDGSY